MHPNHVLHSKQLNADRQPPEFMTSQELEAAIDSSRREAETMVNPALA